MGYKNRTTRLDFDDLGDGVFVTIRNPRLMPMDRLMPKDVAVDESGQPKVFAEAETASLEVMTNLIIEWHVFDANDDSEDPPPLADITLENVRLLPMEIVMRITEEMGSALPS